MTFQVKSRHGLCIDWSPRLLMAPCGDKKKESQQWYIDRRAGVIGNKHGMCIDSVEYLSKGGGIHLQPCIANLTSQQWGFDGITGLIQHKRGLCLDAPKYGAAGSKVHMWPCNLNSFGQLWSFWNTLVLGQSATVQAMNLEARTTVTTTSTLTRTVTVTTTKQVRRAATSLFCWSLMLPWGYEKFLIEVQYKMKRSIFACEEAAVYSNKILNITNSTPNPATTRLVDTDLHCKIGGRYHTALNTPIFLKVWEQILADGRYKLYSWTVKADPDAVFFPWRLRETVATHVEENLKASKGVFMRNCQFGLHGPIEVISKKAMEAYRKGWKSCKKPPQEDVYLQACLLGLGSKQVDSFELLAEDHCQSKDWQKCRSGHVAFHPFKTVESYRTCLLDGDASTLTRTTSL